MTGKQQRELQELREKLGIAEPLDPELSTVAASELLSDYWRRMRQRQRSGIESLEAYSRSSYDAALEWASAVGFTVDQAPFAAVRACMLKGWDGKNTVTKQEVYDGCRERYPDRFPPQLRAVS